MIPSKSLFISLLAFLSFLFANVASTAFLEAQTFQTVDDGPIHEAYVTKVSGSVALEAIRTAPPQPITERIPRQTDPQTEWILGYWSWDSGRQDFLWISGIWRNPPPGRTWIPGFWRQFEEGWVWIPGFWSDAPLEQLTYIDMVPPDQLDEQVGNPPSSDYFWNPGYWGYSLQNRDFIWFSGQWERLDPNWVLVPAHYVWRPGGYIFIAAYWDWPLEQRGSAYASIFIDPSYRYGVIYEPLVIIEPVIILHRLFIYYPDYICFFYHHYYYHPHFWIGISWVPPWWAWNTWWCFNWHDHWSLWWWYAHPGYPHPHWMTLALSSLLTPPHHDLLALFKSAILPSIITPQGVVSPGKLLEAIAKIVGDKMTPILPSNPDLVRQIQTLAEPIALETQELLRPTGKLPLPETPPPKPTTGVDRRPWEIRPAELPPKPILPARIQPRIKPHIKPPGPPQYQSQPPQYQPRPPQYQPRPPQYQPKPPQYEPRPPWWFRPRPQQEEPETPPPTGPKPPQYTPQPPQFKPEIPEIYPETPQYKSSTPPEYRPPSEWPKPKPLPRPTEQWEPQDQPTLHPEYVPQTPQYFPQSPEYETPKKDKPNNRRGEIH